MIRQNRDELFESGTALPALLESSIRAPAMFLTTSIAECHRMLGVEFFLVMIPLGFRMMRPAEVTSFLRAIIAIALLPQIAFAQDVNDGYKPNANGAVNALVLQADCTSLVS